MGDFLLDLRPAADRQTGKAASLLRFGTQASPVILDEPSFGLVVTLTERADLWAPYRSVDGTTVVVAGRVAMDESEWAEGETLQGEGGLACKALYKVFREQGIPGLEKVGGNRVILIHDHLRQRFYLITDWAGAFPAFSVNSIDKPVFCSHPDVLAAVSGEKGALDEISMAEFLFTNTVTPPYTYYKRIRAVPHASTVAFDTHPIGVTQHPAKRYVEISLESDDGRTEDDLAEELADAIRSAVRRRTLPRLGRTAVALSGGLDSRALLASVEDKDQVFAFCCYNESNRELETARAIAAALGVEFRAWQRDFEYYGRTAETGIKVSGGMGTFANNHFLGVIDRLRDEGAKNLLTGCYCDYLFKGLPLNRKSHWLTGRERLAPFQHEFYFSHLRRPGPLNDAIAERLDARVPARFRSQNSAEDIFQVEAHRTFPLCYEGDNQQRLVPQRAAGWYLPMADEAILRIYKRIPWVRKLNRSVYTKAVQRICNGAVARIPDANTGARVGASALTEFLHYNGERIRRSVRGRSGSIATDGSWPDWSRYVAQSEQLRALWKRPNRQAADFFRRVLGDKEVRADTADYAGEEIWVLVSMLTLKLWFEQWE